MLVFFIRLWNHPHTTIFKDFCDSGIFCLFGKHDYCVWCVYIVYSVDIVQPRLVRDNPLFPGSGSHSPQLAAVKWWKKDWKLWLLLSSIFQGVTGHVIVRTLPRTLLYSIALPSRLKKRATGRQSSWRVGYFLVAPKSPRGDKNNFLE